MTSRDRPGLPQTADHPAHTTSGMRDASPAPQRNGFYCAASGRFNVTAVEGLFRQPQSGSPQRFLRPRMPSSRLPSAASRRPARPPQREGGRRRRLNPAHRPQHPQPPIPKPNQPTQGEAV